MLRHEVRRVQTDKQTIVVVQRKLSAKRKRARYYDEKVQTALVRLWRLMDYIGDKRLQPWLPEFITVLERHNEFQCDRETRAKLLRISAASAERAERLALPIRILTVYSFQRRNMALRRSAMYRNLQL